MFLCFSHFRARHFVQVLVISVILVIFEVIYITWDRRETLFDTKPSLPSSSSSPPSSLASSSSSSPAIHEDVSCHSNHMHYMAKVAKSHAGQKELILFINNTKNILTPVDNVIHLLLVDSSNISTYTIESFLFNGSNSSPGDLELPLNKFFVLISGEFTNKSFLKEFFKSKLNLEVNSFEPGDVLVSGFKYNSTEAYIDQVSLISYGSISGCIQANEGLTACESLNKCEANQVFFYASAGSFKAKTSATVCYNNTVYVGPKSVGGRGLNVLLINDATLSLEDVRNFDTFTEGDAFDAYLSSIKDHKIIIIASQDESSTSMLMSSKLMLEEDFGSSVIRKLSYRDHFVFLGQRGLHSGSAIEKLRKHYIDRPVEIKGCLTAGVGVGILRELSFSIPKTSHSFLQFDPSYNIICPRCPPEHLSVSIQTGFKNLKKPNGCIGGKIISQSFLGRGLNIVVYDVTENRISLIQNFDTYDLDDGSIIEVLKNVSSQDLVVFFTFDDAVRMLSPQTRNTLESFGSFYINQLKMRESWILIGQKRIMGYSPYERLNFGQYSSHNWSEPIHFEGCVPYQIPGLFKPSYAETNTNRVHYCSKQESRLSKNYFCSVLNKWQPLHASLLQNPNLVDSPVFSFPIIVFTSSSAPVVEVQFERISVIPGLNYDNVMVFYDPQVKSYETLIKLFKFNGVVYNKSADQNWSLTEYLSTLQTIPENIIVLEEGVLPTKHYLEFLAYLYPVHSSDAKLCCIGAYNHHAYLGMSSTSKLSAFRTTDIPPRLSYMIKTAYLMNNRTQNWEAIIPDVSYVARHPMTPGNMGTSPLVRSYAQGNIKLPKNVNLLHSKSYDKLLIKLLNKAVVLRNLSQHCNVSSSMRKNVISIFGQSHEDDQGDLNELISCFFISTPADSHEIVGLYKGIFRFSHRTGIQVFFVGSKSRFMGYIGRNESSY